MNFYDDKGVAYAIRPENIIVVDEHLPEDYDISARIKHVEFKGPLTRVFAILPNQTEICLDMTSERADGLGLNESSMIFLKMPKEHLVDYS
jgi:hypothetical protein